LLETATLNAHNMLISVEEVDLVFLVILRTEARGQIATNGTAPCADVFFPYGLAELLLQKSF